MNTEQAIALLIGPTGLTVFLLYVVKRLWDRHDETDRDVIAQRNEATTGWRESTATVGRLADAIEASNRDSAERHRLDDARRDRARA
jgi:hypothetical protein